MATKQTPAELLAQQKDALLLAISQIDMFIEAVASDASGIGLPPERVQKAAKEFRDSLKEWAES